MANDEVQEYHAGLFAFDPIRRINEWRAAMLADPNHTRKFSKDDAIAIRRTLPFHKRKYCKFKGTYVSVVQCFKTFVKIGVGIGHTATGGKFLKEGA